MHLRDGPMGTRRSSLRWLHVAVFSSACVATLLIASGVSFWHTDAPGSDDATCPICHLAHMPVMPGTAASVSIKLTIFAWFVQADVREGYVAPPSLDSPPRAPPA
jgi:hypothetical protein